MKILFVGVFEIAKRSTNTSQLLAFKKKGHDVVGYNYREKALHIGRPARDEDLINTIQKGGFDLVVFSKCNRVAYEVFTKATEVTKTCLWFMDPLQTFDDEMRKKASLVSYFCCDKLNVLDEALKINKNSFHVCEGYDEYVDKPYDIEKTQDVSFIGNMYGSRTQWINKIEHDVTIYTSAYGADHARAVSSSRINLNFCTDEGASDRVYKIMAAGGFLLSNDWKGRKKHFTNGRDCVIFKDEEDLNEKIKYYLANPELAVMISKYGREAVKAFSRANWVSKIVELSYDV